MNERWTSYDEAIALQELETARERQRKLVEKEEAKRWQDIPFPLNLADALTRLSKNELSEMRSNLRIRNASALNKRDLIDVLAKQVPTFMEMTLSQLDETRYGVLKRIAIGEGQASVSLEPHEYEYFQRRGLAFTGTVDGNRVLVMPQEVLNVFKLVDGPSLRSTVRRHTEWLQISQGLLFYYGFLSTSDMIQMVEQYSAGKVQFYEHLGVLLDAIDYGYSIRASVLGFTNGDVIDVHRVIAEHASGPDVPFYPFTKAQLIRAAKPQFVDLTPQYKAFVDFLKRSYEIDSAEAEDEAELCIYEIQTGEPLGDIIKAITEEFEIPTLDVLQALTHYVSELHNNTRQWFLKGHTPKELLPADLAAMRPLPGPMGAPKAQVIDFGAKKKVGRNDPCPCGSGKKYKKCCGR